MVITGVCFCVLRTHSPALAEWGTRLELLYPRSEDRGAPVEIAALSLWVNHIMEGRTAGGLLPYSGFILLWLCGLILRDLPGLCSAIVPGLVALWSGGLVGI